MVRAVLLSLVLACEAAPPSRPAQRSGALISDQVHGGGVAGFWFLPPMVAQPSTDGGFDAAIDATIAITDPNGNVVAQFATADGSVAVSDHYQADWHTGGLAEGVSYRITVSSGGKAMGLADVVLFPNMGKAKNVDSDEEIALVDGQTLPIKFWMNLCAPVVCGDACEAPNSCSPATGACAPKPAGAECRASAGVCDIAETCDGVSGSCPADALAAPLTPCTTTADATYSALSACSGESPYCPTRDWSTYPAVAQVDGAPDLWVMSDVHGDYNAFTTLLKGAGLIAAAPATPQAVQWNAGPAVLVIVGDLIDKGPDSHDVVRLVAALQASAAAAGGQVIVTMGNHEAEFLGDPMNSKANASNGIDPELPGVYAPAYGAPPYSLATVTQAARDTAGAGNDIGAFIRHLPIAARVNDWFFVHAGKTSGMTAAQLELTIENGVDQFGFGADTNDPGNVLTYDNGSAGSMLEARLSGTPPQWFDVNGNAQQTLADWAAAAGARHLVMGHQPGAVGFSDGTARAKDSMFQYKGLLFLVDTGLSVGADGTAAKGTDGIMHVTNPGGPNEAWIKVLPNGTTKAF